MNQVHIHLLVTHLPIFGSILGALVLAYGLKTKSYQTIIAAYGVLIIASLGALAAYLTGEGAEHALKGIAGVLSENIHEHEEAAQFAYILSIILGVVSILGLIVTYKASNFTTKLAAIILVISLFSFSVFARTGYLGGQIRHSPEINSIQTQAVEKE